MKVGDVGRSGATSARLETWARKERATLSISVRLAWVASCLLVIVVAQGVWQTARAHSGCPDALVSGPYRKVVSVAGFRKVEGTITLPQVSLVDHDGDGRPDDVAYIHFGGSAWDSTHTHHTEVDAGLKLEIIPGNPNSFRWRPFIATSSAGEIALGDKPFLDPGTTVTLRFYVDAAADGYVRLAVVYGGNTWVSPAVAAPYWTNAGTRQQMKRVNSLGQIYPGRKGSWVGAARWTNLTLYTRDRGSLWTSDWTSIGCTEPKSAVDPDPRVVQVTIGVAHYDESIAIDTNNW